MAQIDERHPGQKVATIWFPAEVLDRVDRLAEKGGIPRSKLIRNLTEIGVDYLEACDNLGLLAPAVVFRDFAAWFKQKCDAGFGVGRRKAKA